MLRFIAMLGCAAALAVAAPVGFEAHAAKKPMSKSCKATGLDGKKVKFKCSAKETCCFDPILNKGTCVSAPGICL
jgi:hypothetical protein